MYRLTENGEVHLLTHEVFDFSGGEWTERKIKEFTNSTGTHSQEDDCHYTTAWAVECSIRFELHKFLCLRKYEGC